MCVSIILSNAQGGLLRADIFSWWKRAGIAFAALLVAALAVACGGDDGDGDDPGSGQDTPAPAGRSTTTPGSGTTQVRAGLGDLNAYKCSLKLEGQGGPLTELQQLYSSGGSATGPIVFEASVTYVRPDKSQLSLKLGEETFTQTTIARQQWTTIGTLTLGPNAVAQMSPTELSMCASFWDEGFASGASAFQCTGGRESLNGVQTRKCGIDHATFDQVRQFLGGVLSDPESGITDLTTFAMDLWVTEGTSSLPGGLPVRVRAEMAGKDGANRDFSMKIEMDVTNINDGGLNVTAPR
jgi:hypothetical protein